jgi:hypothetical protein
MNIEAYDAARSAIEKTGFTPVVKTKITLFLLAAKNTNAQFLGAVEFQPFVGVAQQMLHTQFFHEMESVVLLNKVTQWAFDPQLYTEATRITAPIWGDFWTTLGFQGPGGDLQNYYRGLALGHALLSQVRLTPIIPADTYEADPYVIALRSIEQDNARRIQTQIHLLRAVSPQLPGQNGEALVEEKQEMVKGVFLQFLEWLGKP